MPLTPNFSIAISPGDPGTLIFTDSSTGSDGSVTKRRIYIQGADGDFIVTTGNSNEYEDWDDFPATTTKTLTDILTTDKSARVVVQWLNSGNSVLYDKTLYSGFTGFNEDFDYELTQNVAANPLLMNDNGFWSNKSKLRSYIDSGDQAIQRASDIVSAQQCYDLANEMRTSRQYYFNESAN